MQALRSRFTAPSAAKTRYGSRRGHATRRRTDTRSSAGASGTNLFFVWRCCSGYRRLLRILRRAPRRLMITIFAEARCYEKTSLRSVHALCGL